MCMLFCIVNVVLLMLILSPSPSKCFFLLYFSFYPATFTLALYDLFISEIKIKIEVQKKMLEF